VGVGVGVGAGVGVGVASDNVTNVKSPDVEVPPAWFVEITRK
jgi:hypothetical protein